VPFGYHGCYLRIDVSRPSTSLGAALSNVEGRRGRGGNEQCGNDDGQLDDAHDVLAYRSQVTTAKNPSPQGRGLTACRRQVTMGSCVA